MNGSAQDAAARRPSVSRRDFLRVGGTGVVALSAAGRAAAETVSHKRCVFLLMTGGAGHLDTFDPKPDAPSDHRGPLRAIATTVPGVFLSEGLPRLARRFDKFSLVRSLAHDAAPIHETGLQLLQTGSLSHRGARPPHFGAAVARRCGLRAGSPPAVVLPRPLDEMGTGAWRGQGAGCLGEEYEPRPIAAERVSAEFDSACRRDGRAALSEGDASCGIATFGMPAGSAGGGPLALPPIAPNERERYGDGRFGTLCLEARRLIEAGVRCVTVNLFDSIANRKTWDCHGRGPSSPATVSDYRDTLCPRFDQALSALLDDLDERGLLQDTLVVATGEFGRTPKLNESGGRDHWPHAWSALIAGAGSHGGEVIGATDARGARPIDRPTSPSEIHALVMATLGVSEAYGGVSEAALVGGHSRSAERAPHEVRPKPLVELFG